MTIYSSNNTPESQPVADRPGFITVLGDGGWGTAMAIAALRRGHAVTLWGYDPDYLVEMQVSRENSRFLPGYQLPEQLQFCPDIIKAILNADLILSVIPTAYLRQVMTGLAQQVQINVTKYPELTRRIASAVWISLTKGIEPQTLLRPTEIITSVISQVDGLKLAKLVALSGPSHAENVIEDKPTIVTVASESRFATQLVQENLASETLRIYRSSDVIGVELGGALKNVIAIAAGICIGLDLGDNALAALVSRGLAEISRLGIAMNAEPRTFAGLSGMGDLVVTCISQHGRNRALGIEIGKGRKLSDILASTAKVAEGVVTVESAYQLSKKLGIDMPITEQVYAVLRQDKNPRQAVQDLLTRAFKDED